jgi:uncharacterized protein
MRTVRSLLPALAGLAAVALVAGCSGDSGGIRSAAAQESEPSRATITARGVGTVTGVPDVLTIHIGVETRADTAAAALDDNNGRTQALLDLLKTEGVTRTLFVTW